MRRSWRAITSLSSVVIPAPGDCSPSRNVVSNMAILRVICSSFASRGYVLCLVDPCVWRLVRHVPRAGEDSRHERKLHGRERLRGIADAGGWLSLMGFGRCLRALEPAYRASAQVIRPSTLIREEISWQGRPIAAQLQQAAAPKRGSLVLVADVACMRQIPSPVAGSLAERGGAEPANFESFSAHDDSARTHAPLGLSNGRPAMRRATRRGYTSTSSMPSFGTW